MLKYGYKDIIKILVIITLIFTTNCSVNNSNIVDRTPEAEDPWEKLLIEEPFHLIKNLINIC